MNTVRRKQVAAALIILPLVVGAAIRHFGGDSFIVEWEGTVRSPKTVQFEFHDFGAVLIAISAVGLVWLAYLVIRGFFPSKSSDDQTVGS